MCVGSVAHCMSDKQKTNYYSALNNIFIMLLSELCEHLFRGHGHLWKMAGLDTGVSRSDVQGLAADRRWINRLKLNKVWIIMIERNFSPKKSLDDDFTLKVLNKSWLNHPRRVERNMIRNLKSLQKSQEVKTFWDGQQAQKMGRSSVILFLNLYCGYFSI